METTWEWVPVMVPASMAPQVLRDVAAFVLADHEAATGPRDWGAATDDDRTRVLIGDKPVEWQMLVHLSRASEPLPASQLAERVGVEVDDIAGLVGPLNKRARRAGWVSPIQTRTMFRAGKGLMLHEALGWWVLSRDNDLDRAEAAEQAGGRLVASSPRTPKGSTQ